MILVFFIELVCLLLIIISRKMKLLPILFVFLSYCISHLFFLPYNEIPISSGIPINFIRLTQQQLITYLVSSNSSIRNYSTAQFVKWITTRGKVKKNNNSDRYIWDHPESIISM